MELKQRKCPVCGGQFAESNGKLICEYCGALFEYETSERDENKILSYLDYAKQESLSNARLNLYNATHEKYLSKDKVKSCVREVKKLYPDDFMASFYEAIVNENKNALNVFLNNIDLNQYQDYKDEVIKGTIKSMDYSNVIALKNFVDIACPLEDKNRYNTEIEALAEKMEEGVYSLDIDRDFFICYSSKDVDKVCEIVDFLESNGLSCFVALRNLRHGVGSQENYKKSIEKAMKNSKGLIFLSSDNSRNMGCDTLRFELPYLKNELKGMPRIEYLLENYSPKTSIFAKNLIKQTFDGLEWCKTLDDLAERAGSIIFGSGFDGDTVENNIIKQNSTKFCVSCGTENDIDTKFCKNCGSNEFAKDIQDLIRIQNEKRDIELKKKEEEIKKKLEGERKLEEERRLEAKKLEEERKKLEEEKKKLEEERKLKEKKELEEKKRLEEEKKKQNDNKSLSDDFKKLIKDADLDSFFGLDKDKAAVEKELKVGDIVTFGNYKQGANGEAKPIEWIISGIHLNCYQLISLKLLRAMRFSRLNVTYDKSDVRAFLNNEFYNEAFSASDIKYMLNGNLKFADSKNPNTPQSPTLPSEKVFISSPANYLALPKEYVKAVSTEYCKKHDGGTLTNQYYHVYWTNIKGNSSEYVTCINYEGARNDFYKPEYAFVGVRPSIFVKKERFDGTVSNTSTATTNSTMNTVKSSTDNATTKSVYKIGDIVKFGNYRQGAKGEVQPIEWVVSREYDNCYRLISLKALTSMKFGVSNVTYDKSSIRKWCTDDFYNSAFSADDKKRMIGCDMSFNDKRNPNTRQSPALKDEKVYVPDPTTYLNLVPSARTCVPTDYCLKVGAFRPDKIHCIYWTCYKGNDDKCVSCITEKGERNDFYKAEYAWIGIRPAIFLRK